MHEYSIDTNTRKTVVIIIFILSCCTSCLLGELLNFIINYYALQVEESTALTHMRNFLKFIEFPNLIGVGVIYELISFVHDRWAWKLFHMFNGVPNLNGHWTGTLSSSYGPDNIKMEMDITQTWSRISFKSRFPDTPSSSFSNHAAIQINNNSGITILFGFQNQSEDIANLQTYYGYNILTLEQGGNQIRAMYFNNRPSLKSNSGGNMGTFELKRENIMPAR